MGALLEQKISNIDLRRILITFVNDETFDLSCELKLSKVNEFVNKFENGEITFEEVE